MSFTRTNPALDDGFSQELAIALRRVDGRGLREQLEAELRAAIQRGRLPEGSALPPSRILARELGVARSVVVDAYGQLSAEGYVEARQGSGTRVRATVAREAPEPAGLDRRAAERIRLLPGRPDPASFPRQAWQRSYRAALAALPDAAFGYADRRGAAELRRAIAGHLGRVRAVTAAPDDLLVCGGFTQGLALVCRALRARGATRIAVEDPCFGFYRNLVVNAGLEAVPAPVDAHGIDVAALAREDVAAVLVAPAHSYPSGAVLSPERRVALVRWAQDADALVIEDDYDAEFRYDRAPIGALQGLRPERVVYGGTISKTLSPALRLGWLAAPAWLLADLRREKLYDDLSSSLLDQLALARFVEGGDLARHLRRVRPVYRRRRDAALRALAAHLPDAAPGGVAAGLHLYVRLPPGCDERALVDAARERGVRIEGAAWHWADPAGAPPALVLGYAGADEATLERGIAAVGAAYAALR